MYLARLIDYAQQNDVKVYDNAYPLAKHVVTSIKPERAVFLAAGLPRYVRALYLARAIEVITGQQLPETHPKQHTACRGQGFGAALR